MTCEPCCDPVGDPAFRLASSSSRSRERLYIRAGMHVMGMGMGMGMGTHSTCKICTFVSMLFRWRRWTATVPPVQNSPPLRLWFDFTTMDERGNLSVPMHLNRQPPAGHDHPPPPKYVLISICMYSVMCCETHARGALTPGASACPFGSCYHFSTCGCV